MTDLFSLPKPVAKAPPARMVGTGIPFRWCQAEDVDALMYAIETGYNRPCCVGATGYGKGALTAEIAGRLHANGGKVVCLIDRAHLVHQTADEWERHLDIEVGRVADGECLGLHLPFVVATVQAMYTPDRSGKPLYTYPHLEGTKAVICDESHRFFAPCYRAVAEHFAEMNDAVIVGFTATPVAANGSEWRDFFNWTPEVEGPCMRTVRWCVENGLLVPPRQAFVHIDLRLDELYARLTDEADPEDETAEDAGAVLLDLLRDKGEQDAARFASGVADIIGKRKGIIFSPPRVTAAQLLASWLSATGRMTCDAVWGARADKMEALAKFVRGRPQVMTNVNILCEGFNHPSVSAVFICRLLKQWRLVQQMCGRALRPHPSAVDAINALDGPDKAERRREVIAQSVKPDALIADLVGLDDKVLRASAVDVMFPDASEDVRREAGETIFRGAKSRGRQPDVDADLMELARSRLLAKQHEALAEMARRRGMAGEIPADVSVTYSDQEYAEMPRVPAAVEHATEGEKAMFVAHAVQYELSRAVGIANRTPRNQLKGMTFSMKKKLATDGIRPNWQRAREAFPEWARRPR